MTRSPPHQYTPVQQFSRVAAPERLRCDRDRSLSGRKLPRDGRGCSTSRAAEDATLQHVGERDGFEEYLNVATELFPEFVREAARCVCKATFGAARTAAGHFDRLFNGEDD